MEAGVKRISWDELPWQMILILWVIIIGTFIRNYTDRHMRSEYQTQIQTLREQMSELQLRVGVAK